MENPLNLPWTVSRSNVPWDGDWVYLVDCTGKDITTFYNVQSGDKVALIQNILDKCNADAPLPAPVAEEQQ